MKEKKQRGLLRYLDGFWRQSILAPLFKLLEALFDLLVPLVVAEIINVGINQGDTGVILRCCGLLVLLGVVGLACSITAQWFAAHPSNSAGEIKQRKASAIYRRSMLRYTEGRKGMEGRQWRAGGSAPGTTGGTMAE